ncbi:ABC transporter ATP-binding protein [Donghicola eburneus]|mgnify:FL=1|jgi:putative spermidine/putrescine transport system ATP-binding protein/spermidine/putrescine transport system ATP-binding protein|uniref:Spermidine/putrescine import ATP-binding protein PotA n=1 Tax=Donghicola eburneus TaxID=393278 RepID=A0A1M4MVH6_9RHOB|nr:ABC transporter ATP-binding protein [Donghicola eburneus]SCM66370.1 Spermidine/putrescine import ATP-binding protein PotA [Donghicola eburneus]SFQ66710.1 putative spermidine/putrescine transport system ATP-binding protein/spermidine/putrescine transport system ATP-binding protein [Donghicola eburneus]
MVYDLELISVGKTYSDGTVAVSDFDLKVEKGEFVAFLGPSGCGKSTTLRMIAGFEDITNGEVMMMGRNVTHVPPEKRPTSMIFQNYALFPHMSVRENVAFGLDVKGTPKAERDRKVDRILDMFDLEPFADRKADKLSGGQRQRIALARGLVVEPEILLLDEPLGALDANLRRIIQNELKLLQRELGITFVFVTHAQSEALGLSDRVVVMSNGVVEQISPPRELYRRPATPFVADFIGSNTVFEGTPKGTAGSGFGQIDTPYGIMTGLGQGNETLAVVPAEAFRIVPMGTPNEILLHGTLAERQLVGAVGHLKIRLPGDRDIAVEVSADRPEVRTLTPGAPVTLGVDPASVTLIHA